MIPGGPPLADASPPGPASSDFAPTPEAWRPRPTAPGLAQRVLGAVGGKLAASADEVALPDELDAAGNAVEKFITSAPPWLLSMIVHFTFMIVLGLVVLKTHTINQSKMSVEVDIAEPPVKDEIWAENIGQQLETPTPFASTEGLTKDIPSFPTRSDLPEVDDPLIGPPVLNVSPDGLFASGTEGAPNVGFIFKGRQIGMKEALLKSYGGTKSTQDAVREGLLWLIRRQQSNGMWSLRGPFKDGSAVENEEAATAMALLALQGDGHTPQSSSEEDFKKAVTRGWAALLRRLQPDGRFFGDVPSSHRLYTQAQCTIAICELYGMTRDPIYREPAQRAVDYCVRVQAPLGGWRYEPGVDSDMSVTGWFVMALQSARLAGLEVPSPTLERVKEFLDSVAREDGSRYAYQLRNGATVALTAEGLLCRQYLGWQRDDPRLQAGVDYLLANVPTWNDRNVYYWYYGTQVCHHMEGTAWQKWNSVTRQLLPERQEKRGAEKGSWNPAGDRWGTSGRLYVTCLSLYILEVYYRHLPIYQKGVLGP
jgi:hypothetical protein